MFSKRMSITAQVKHQSTTPKPRSSTDMKSVASASTIPNQHYNDWPNAVGFDAAYEEHTPVELVVKGYIPGYAAGTLFRTGIGPRSIENGDHKLVYRTQHWFDGFSQVHRFQLHSTSNLSDLNAGIEKITYNSRLMSDKLITRIQNTGKWDEITFAAKYEPCKTFFQKLQSVFEKAPEHAPDEVCNAVTISLNYPGLSSSGVSQDSPHHNPSNKTVTVCNKTDSSRFQFFDPETLQPTGLAMQTKLHPDLKGVLAAAHSASDPTTGNTFNFNMDFSGAKATYRVFKTCATSGKTSILTTINHAPAYLHSTFLTENFLIMCIWNSHFTKAGASILWTKNLLDAMYFNDKVPATWYVVDRRDPVTEGGKGVVAKFESDPFFCFHTVNAYETANDNGTVDITCDLVVYADTSVLHTLYMDNLQSNHQTAHSQALETSKGHNENTRARLRRYKLTDVPLPSLSSPLKPQSKASKALIVFTAPASSSPELPTIHPSHMGKPYRYTYGILGPDGSKSTFVDGLVKFGLQTQQAITWQETGQTPGEAIFIPKPGENLNEDDGVLLSVVLDGYTGKSYLLCLDAKELKELGRAEVDGTIGFGFHGVHTSSL